MLEDHFVSCATIRRCNAHAGNICAVNVVLIMGSLRLSISTAQPHDIVRERNHMRTCATAKEQSIGP